MAARRLIIVLVLLFAVSIAAAAIAPQRPATTSTTSTDVVETKESSGPSDGQSAGTAISGRLRASESSPGTVRAKVGNQLALSVSVDEPLEIEISQLGLIGNAGPAAPALFDILLRTPGDVPITDAATGRVVGHLIVEP